MECLNCSSIRTPTTTISGGGRFQKDLHFRERFFTIVGKKWTKMRKTCLLDSPWNRLTRMRVSKTKVSWGSKWCGVECESRFREVWIVRDGRCVGYCEEEGDAATMTKVEFGARCLVVRRLAGLELAEPHVCLPNISAKKFRRSVGPTSIV